ncbi:MAG: hypothetical protein Q9O24_02310 [Gammaproteobacteria bacterium]|nr:hypothetical protein [Gammaproteobacteria bacterium]
MLRRFRRVSVFLVIFFTLGVSSSVLAESLQPASLEDQWGKKQTLSYVDGWFILAADKTRGEWVKESLLALKVTDLTKHKLVYVADLSSIPSFMLSFVGLPILKELPFKVLLDREGEVSKTWPRKEDKITVFLSQKGEVKEVRFFDSQESLEGFLRSNILI